MSKKIEKHVSPMEQSSTRTITTDEALQKMAEFDRKLAEISQLVDPDSPNATIVEVSFSHGGNICQGCGKENVKKISFRSGYHSRTSIRWCEACTMKIATFLQGVWHGNE